MTCDQCQVVSINGIPCHETGCPNAWKGKAKSCRECGYEFLPESRWQVICEGCALDEARQDQTIFGNE